jgi:hypothetical protein
VIGEKRVGDLPWPSCDVLVLSGFADHGLQRSTNHFSPITSHFSLHERELIPTVTRLKMTIVTGWRFGFFAVRAHLNGVIK